MPILVNLMLSQRPLKLSFFFFLQILYSSRCSDGVCSAIFSFKSLIHSPVLSFEKFGSLEGTRGIKRSIEKEENFVFDSLFVDARSLN